MPRKSPDEEWDPDAYEAEQYQRERAARLRREAEAGLWRAAWAKERAKPILQRRFFSFAEIAEQLSQNPRTLETNPGLRERIIEDLTRSRAEPAICRSRGCRPNQRSACFPGI